MSLAAVSAARNWAGLSGRPQLRRSGASRPLGESLNTLSGRSINNQTRSLRLLNTPEHVRGSFFGFDRFFPPCPGRPNSGLPTPVRDGIADLGTSTTPF